MRNICVEVAGLLEEVANSAEDDDEEQPQRASASQRFADAVLSSTAAATAMGLPTDDTSRCNYTSLFGWRCVCVWGGGGSSIEPLPCSGLPLPLLRPWARGAQDLSVYMHRGGRGGGRGKVDSPCYGSEQAKVSAQFRGFFTTGFRECSILHSKTKELKSTTGSTKGLLRRRGELAETFSPEALIHDSVTRMFWRNVKARSTGQSSQHTSTAVDLPADQIGDSPETSPTSPAHLRGQTGIFHFHCENAS